MVSFITLPHGVLGFTLPAPPLSPCPGTPDYASTASLYENELGPRDDMESLAYTLLYLWMGKLPW